LTTGRLGVTSGPEQLTVFFADLLTAEPQRQRPDDVAGLHARAFEWLRDDDQIAAAVDHVLTAGECDAAAVLFCAAALIAEELGVLTGRPSEEAEASDSPG
jgi:ATP/maltotriose-dependent transcriptional regulator MalT